MSHITSFSVEGLAGRPGVYTQKLHRNVNVFFGRNGSGKTSLLKIFHSAMSNDIKLLRRVTFTEAQVRIYTLKYNRELTYRFIPGAVKGGGPPIQWAQQLQFLEDQPLSPTLRRMLRQASWQLTPEDPNVSPSEGGWAHRFLPTSRLVDVRPEAAALFNEETY